MEWILQNVAKNQFTESDICVTDLSSNMFR